MRIRTIKPEFWESESIGRLSREARLLFIGLWSMSDDSGRFRGHSRIVANTLFPYDEDVGERVEGWLCELECERMIRRYKANGSTYGEICNWLIHQKIDKPGKAKYPSSESFREDSRDPLETSSEDQGSGIRDQGAGITPPSPPELPLGDTPNAAHSAGAGNGSDPWKSILPSPLPKTKAEQNKVRVLANSPTMKRIGEWFGQQDSTLWTVTQALSLRTLELTRTELDQLEAYYRAPIPKDQDIRRRDLSTMLNNARSSELDRARRWTNGGFTKPARDPNMPAHI